MSTLGIILGNKSSEMDLLLCSYKHEGSCLSPYFRWSDPFWVQGSLGTSYWITVWANLLDKIIQIHSELNSGWFYRSDWCMILFHYLGHVPVCYSWRNGQSPWYYDLRHLSSGSMSLLVKDSWTMACSWFQMAVNTSLWEVAPLVLK